MDEQEQDFSKKNTKKLRPQRRPVTAEFLEQVMQVRAQVIKDANGYIFEDSTELIRQMREERTRELMQAITGKYDEDPDAEDASEEQA